MTISLDSRFDAYVTRRNYRSVVVEFPNGYGASIINDGYGKETGGLELAVLKDGRLCYTTEITSDVLGRLSAQEVAEILDRIKAILPALEGLRVLREQAREAAERAAAYAADAEILAAQVRAAEAAFGEG